ncbi:hypothetical protein RD792_001919 [Penstemon davidsonii]|uniref:K Homology domain-containing protein n=1 Tax=Penstemon davidsonii TaxID=160366 RepID=A0ABR0DQW1_9LAMI|nr:hypothetical protein RD792_001919 [Penstemon davidsonii]
MYTNNTSAATPPAYNGGASSRRPQPPLYIPTGQVGFRLLCHASRVGGLIGKSGSIVKQIQQLTNSKIRVDDPSNSAEDHRVITVIASPVITKRIKLSIETSPTEVEEENGWGDEGFEVSAAQEGIVRVFERVVELTADGDIAAAVEGVVSCRLLAGKNQVGAIIGKGGKIVEKIREDTGCRIKVLVSEKIRSSSFPNEEIVEIEGDVLAVKKALVAVTNRLQEFPPHDRTRMYGTRPLEESLPVPSVDLPMQRSPVIQPMPSNSITNTLGDGPSLVDSEKFLTQQQRVVFKMLCPGERIGSIIGKGGSIIKSLINETGTFINIGPTVPECDERLITITAMENVESQYSPAQNTAVVLFKKYMDAGPVNGLDSGSNGSPVLARVVVPANQAGCLLGKGGAIISEMRKVTGAGLRIIGGNQVPKCAPDNVEILQITGEFVNVQDALFKVTGRLRDYIFSQKMSNVIGNRDSLRIENLNEHKSLSHSMNHLGISNTINHRQQSPSLLASTTSSGGRGAIIGTNTTVEIVVPDNAIGSVFGENGSNLDRLRQISRANVVVDEPRPGTKDRIVSITGIPSEIQAAQSLLQAFILAGSS